MRESMLRGANLQGADLRDADLRGADLTGARLAGAILMGCRLEDAVLTGCDMPPHVLHSMAGDNSDNSPHRGYAAYGAGGMDSHNNTESPKRESPWKVKPWEVSVITLTLTLISWKVKPEVLGEFKSRLNELLSAQSPSSSIDDALDAVYDRLPSSHCTSSKGDTVDRKEWIDAFKSPQAPNKAPTKASTGIYKGVYQGGYQRSPEGKGPVNAITRSPTKAGPLKHSSLVGKKSLTLQEMKA